jgi:NTP pyrophosphatase (non-canonical NTP hydrolase)
MVESNMSDTSTSVDELRELLRVFVAARQWERFHNPKNLAMSLAIETAELMEHFQWLTPEEAGKAIADPAQREAICDEVADCLAYILSIANTLDIDLSTELARKMKKNELKYPVDEALAQLKPLDD